MPLPRDPHQTRPAPRAASTDPGEAPVLPSGTAAVRPALPAQADAVFDSQHVRLSQTQLNWQARNDAALRQAALTAMRNFHRQFKDLPMAAQVILAITRTLAREKEPIA